MPPTASLLVAAVAGAALVAGAAPATADPATVVGARLAPAGDGWRIDVTLAHPDTGWSHYADGWRVEAADGTVLGERPLLHPHVTEQPFTRGLSGLHIPPGLATVHVRARDSLDGWAAGTTPVAVPDR